MADSNQIIVTTTSTGAIALYLLLVSALITVVLALLEYGLQSLVPLFACLAAILLVQLCQDFRQTA